MNVDENVTTTDFGPGLNYANDTNTADANMTMNATDVNRLAANNLPDLSVQRQTAVNYSTIEAAADHFASMLMKHGVLGARTYSERCHKDVQSAPSWDSADSCAAFDFAAAYVDEAVTRQANLPKDPYFQFQRSNQADNYAGIGAPSYATESRLSKIREAAENAALEAMRIQLARRKTSDVTKPSSSADPFSPMSDNSSIAANSEQPQ
jgi:hypothetical protein